MTASSCSAWSIRAVLFKGSCLLSSFFGFVNILPSPRGKKKSLFDGKVGMRGQ
ncbi:hypothetical protein L209DRAFT_168629 [Thermothelomyces heterothallicus CBS 203.75]